MNKFMIGTALGAMLLAGGIAIAQPAAPADAPNTGPGAMHGMMQGDGQMTKAALTARLDKVFAAMDTNGDGKLTKAERDAFRQQRADARFARVDTDKNGEISKSEFEAMRGPGARGGRHHPGGKMTGGIGARADADKDGTISHGEFMARPLVMFDRMDVNKDGVVTAAERQAARANRPHRGMGGGMARPDMPPPGG